MGSVGAMKDGAADRYFQEDNTANVDKLVPEGIEGRVPYKGSVMAIIRQLTGGVRASMGYCGSNSIATWHETSEFVQITAAGMRESHVHDVQITEGSAELPYRLITMLARPTWASLAALATSSLTRTARPRRKHQEKGAHESTVASRAVFRRLARPAARCPAADVAVHDAVYRTPVAAACSRPCSANCSAVAAVGMGWLLLRPLSATRLTCSPAARTAGRGGLVSAVLIVAWTLFLDMPVQGAGKVWLLTLAAVMLFFAEVQMPAAKRVRLREQEQLAQREAELRRYPAWRRPRVLSARRSMPSTPPTRTNSPAPPARHARMDPPNTGASRSSPRRPATAGTGYGARSPSRKLCPNAHRGTTKSSSLDFGSQVTQLIARRVREAHVYCEVHPCDVTDEWVREYAADGHLKGVILSGSHASVYEETTDKRAAAPCSDLGVPVLGICYGMQTMARAAGRQGRRRPQREFGFADGARAWPHRAA